MNSNIIETASIYFLDIKFDSAKDKLLTKFKVGNKIYELPIKFEENVYYPHACTHGLTINCKIINTSYTIFITSREINQILSRKKYNKLHDWEYDNWFIQFLISFKGFYIYFLRSISNYSDAFVNDYSIFKGFYQTSRQSKNIKEYIMLNLPPGHSILFPMVNSYVSFCNRNKGCNVMIGDFNYINIKGYAYIFQSFDLSQIYSENNEQLFFTFEDRIFPVPKLPLLSSGIDFKISSFDVYSIFISSTELLSIYISTIDTIKVLDNPCNCSSPLDNLIYVSNDDYGSEPEREQELSEITYLPTKEILFPKASLSAEDLSTDYHLNSSFDEEEEPNEYPDYWDSLDTREKYEENFELAEREFAIDEELLDEYDNYGDDEDSYFYSEVDAVRNFFEKIIVKEIKENSISFEVERLFEDTLTFDCPTIQNPFVRNMFFLFSKLNSVYFGDIQLFIIQKCPKLLLNKIIQETTSFKKYKIFKFGDFFICINLKPNLGKNIFKDDIDSDYNSSLC